MVMQVCVCVCAVMGSSAATCSEATSLTTFPSSLAVASLLYLWSNVPVVKLFFLSSSDVASTKATHFRACLRKTAVTCITIWF